ncbi:hypothetical protein XELAEV_18015305mg [Xenopus laevis]|uniref:Uncharacterized protein n=1 Tax=Xenopus laevis TaxID=8355 RepID=A0A974DJE5_XENLA|nr:hypothetical protein XELAEV_18015305mg [Xenopus laevis]
MVSVKPGTQLLCTYFCTRLLIYIQIPPSSDKIKYCIYSPIPRKAKIHPLAFFDYILEIMLLLEMVYILQGTLTYSPLVFDELELPPSLKK